MSRKKIIAGNWKMNITPSKALELLSSMKEKAKTNEHDVVFCVPFVNLQIALDTLKDTNIKVGAQNMHFEDSGAYTGEISPLMLKDMGVKYVIIGHSERREYFLETDEIVNKKVLKAIEHNIIPIICVGESLKQREENITLDYIRMQTKIALKNVNRDDAKNIIIAYEPIWAIGTGKTATKEQAEEVCKAIRKCLSEIYDKEISEVIKIVYGGSVNEKNAKELFSMNNIDGGLVGGASIKQEFEKIVNY